jgi:hypothetical protein
MSVELSVCKHFSENVIKIKKERLSSKLWISIIFSNEMMTYNVFFII